MLFPLKASYSIVLGKCYLICQKHNLLNPLSTLGNAITYVTYFVPGKKHIGHISSLGQHQGFEVWEGPQKQWGGGELHVNYIILYVWKKNWEVGVGDFPKMELEG